MFAKDEGLTISPDDWPCLCQPESNEHCCVGIGWEEFELGLVDEDFLEVFELGDETTEPDPQPGDFWGQIDDEKLI